MANSIRFKRGDKAQLPTLAAGEPAVCLDTKQVFIGSNSGNIQLVTETELSAANHSHSNKAVLDGIDAPKISGWNGKATTATYTGTFAAANWTAGTAPYAWQQSVSVAGILSADNPVVGQLFLGTTADAIEAERETMGNITRITTAAGSVTALCLTDKLAVAVKIQMKVVR